MLISFDTSFGLYWSSTNAEIYPKNHFPSLDTESYLWESPVDSSNM